VTSLLLASETTAVGHDLLVFAVAMLRRRRPTSTTLLRRWRLPSGRRSG